MVICGTTNFSGFSGFSDWNQFQWLKLIPLASFFSFLSSSNDKTLPNVKRSVPALDCFLFLCIFRTLPSVQWKVSAYDKSSFSLMKLNHLNAESLPSSQRKEIYTINYMARSRIQSSNSWTQTMILIQSEYLNSFMETIIFRRKIV